MSKVEPLLTIDQVSKILGIGKSTLYRWRATGIGPAAVQMPGGIRFRPQTVNDWILAHEEEFRVPLLKDNFRQSRGS